MFHHTVYVQDNFGNLIFKVAKTQITEQIISRSLYFWFERCLEIETTVCNKGALSN